jgi:hypothetical protein
MSGDPATEQNNCGASGSSTCVCDPARRAGGIARVCDRDAGPGTRGVSYALGFVVVFSLVVAGTLALFVAGVDLLSDVDRDGAVAAGEENTAVVHAEVGDMATQGDERRRMPLELVDAQIRLTDTETVELRVETGGVFSVTYRTRALRYELPDHDVTFVYALGHLYRVDERGDGRALSERPPPFEVSDRQTRLVVPVLTGPTPGSPTGIGVSGTGERELVALRSGSPASLTRTDRTGVDSILGQLTINNTDHPSVWVTALEATGFGNVTRTETGVRGRFESDRLTVHQADIAFALGGEES